MTKKRAKVGRKFKLHGAYKRKADAQRKERSKKCKKCFIVTRKVKRALRYVVLGAK